MEKEELLETFEAARKAADVAEAERCVDALRRLRKIPVTTKDLVETQVGKRLRYLTKHSEEKIRDVASDVLHFWKNVVIEETSKTSGKSNNLLIKKSTKFEKAESMKVEKMKNGGDVKSVMDSECENMKVEISNGETVIKAEKVSISEKMQVDRSGSGRIEKISAGETRMVEKIIKEENQAPGSICPPKLSSIIRCNNPARDKYREILAEAFSKVSSETMKSERQEVRDILDEVNLCDPFRVAVTVESVLFEKLGLQTGTHKQKYRSIMFNLKDGNNTDFRRRVLLGDVQPENIVDLTPEEMASDDRKRQNQQIKEKALFECERAGAPKATTDQFKCGRCGQRKTTYYQLQTRSADEPMTTFVTCVNCNNHWKFC